MKKGLVLFMVLIAVLACLLVGCRNKETLHCYVPDGAPALAVANVVQSQKLAKHKVETQVTTGEDVVAKCQSGEADLAILPTNAAVTVCSVRKEYCIYSVNIYGLLYVVGTQQVASLSELNGQTVYSIGLGNTPEYVFKKILDVQHVDYTSRDGIEFEYVADGSTVIPLILQNKAKFAVLGEPAVTNLINKAASQNKTVYRLFDLQQLWQQATGSSTAGYPQACLIVKRDLLKNSNFKKALHDAVFGNSDFLKNNCASLNSLMRGAGSSLDVNYTEEILARCNITPVLAHTDKNNIETYLATFSAMNKYLPLDDSLFYE